MTKLMITYLLLTVIPISLLGYVAYWQYTESVETQVGKYIPQLLEQSNENLTNQMNKIRQLPDILYNSPHVIEVLRKDSYQSQSSLLQDEFQLNSFLSKTYINGGNADILGVFILSKNRLFRSTKSKYDGLDHQTSSFPYGQDLEILGREEVILPYQTDLTFEGNPPFILLMRQLRDYENQETLGTMLIAVELSFLEKTLKSLNQDQEVNIWITDSTGRIIYHTIPRLIGQVDIEYPSYPRINGSFRTTGNHEHQLISRNKSIGLGWSLFHSIPLENLTKESNLVRNGTIVVFIIFVLLSAIISIILAWNVSNPLKKLAKLMNQVEQGNFSVDLSIKSKDEVGMLARSFNSMIQEINQLIKQNYQIELRQKDAELYALQSQINPHFMYNTLETIGYAIEEDDKEAVVKMVTLLGRMLRYSLNNKEKLVPISHEVMHINDYLTIQKFRFEDRIDFKFHQELDGEQYFIPKFVLQPIIENAIKYGLEQQYNCRIEIYIMMKENREVYLTIRDNGPGIDEDILIKLNESLKLDPMTRRDSKFGLINVHARVAMIFGEPFGLQVKSEHNNGTEVIVRIPAMTGHDVVIENRGEASA
ncbi:cache domain-containing sensor histidine kinase [Litchfieldia salsa]|uniref:Two-component system, sensor histidine kinase YesM n=1 Tax=Litchfieldia salsa TaxID=930152 RepID=A0A1H0PY22_9BACI|nr:sensor histidine kinase [Litchfieldia salsa]SDP10022.1 two-component system, sensor histidine kinase YesM [Litchfieldia salsa]